MKTYKFVKQPLRKQDNFIHPWSCIANNEIQWWCVVLIVIDPRSGFNFCSKNVSEEKYIFCIKKTIIRTKQAKEHQDKYRYKTYSLLSTFGKGPRKPLGEARHSEAAAAALVEPRAKRQWGGGRSGAREWAVDRAACSQSYSCARGGMGRGCIT